MNTLPADCFKTFKKFTDMSLEKRVMEGIKNAMLGHDEKTLRGLRAIKAAILSLKTSSGFSGTVTEADEVKMLQKLIKQRKDSLDIYEKQHREDLASKEREEIEIIESFLPKQLSEEEIETAVLNIIKSSGASSMAEMGKVMGAANKELAGKADGKTISAIVKKLLSAR